MKPRFLTVETKLLTKTQTIETVKPRLSSNQTVADC